MMCLFIQHGLIHTGDEEYFIEPIIRRRNGGGGQDDEVNGGRDQGHRGHPHLIYKRSALPDHSSHLFQQTAAASDIEGGAQKATSRRHGTCGVKTGQFLHSSFKTGCSQGDIADRPITGLMRSE